MPTAPVSQGPQVAPGQMPGVMLNPSAASPQAFGAGMGAAIQGQVGGALMQIYREETAKADEIALTNAITDAYKADNRHRYGDGSDGGLPGVALMEGDQLFSNAAKASQAFQKDLSGISERLTPNQRLRFTQGTQGLMRGFESSLAVRIAQERRRRSDEAAGNAIVQIRDTTTQKAALEPDSMGAESLLESAMVTDMTVRSGFARRPSPPGEDVVSTAITQEQYKTTRGVLEQLLVQEKFGQVDALLKDERLNPYIDPNMRSHALAKVKTFKENFGVYESVETAFGKANAAVQVPEYSQRSLEEKTAKTRELSRALLSVEFASDPELRKKALDGLEAQVANDYRAKRLEQAGMTETFANQLLEGRRTLSQIQQLPAYEALSVNQKTQLGLIHNARDAMPPGELEKRNAAVRSYWSTINTSAPEDVKEALAFTPNIQFTAVPSVKELSAQPLVERQKDPTWVFVRYFFPELNVENPGAGQVKQAQETLNGIWPMSPKDVNTVVTIQESVRSDLSKRGDKWDVEVDRLFHKVAKEQMRLLHRDQKGASMEALVAEHYDLLNRSKNTIPSYSDRRAIPSEEDILKISSQLIVEYAKTPRAIIADKMFTLEDLEKAKPETQKKWEDTGYIPIGQISPLWRADIEKKLKPFGRPNERDIERIAFTEWIATKRSLRPTSVIRP